MTKDKDCTIEELRSMRLRCKDAIWDAFHRGEDRTRLLLRLNEIQMEINSRE